jgi:hypothetical protein
LEIKSKQNQKENSIKRLALACINNTSWVILNNKIITLVC